MRRVVALVLLLRAAAGLACRPAAPPVTAGRLTALRAEHDRLHKALDARVADDRVVREALSGEDAALIVAVRAPLLQDVLRHAARVYFERMTLDLGAVHAKARGRLDRDTLLGKLRIGDWRLDIDIVELRAQLQARPPHLRLTGPDEVELRVPMVAREAPGRINLRFAWDSASVANLVCRDFEVTREIEGRTPTQEHTIGGTYRIAAGPHAVRAEPVTTDDEIRLVVDLPETSWAVVSEALEAHDSLGRCGLLMDPPAIVAELRALAARGLRVRLPRVMFRGIRLPGSFERAARIEGRPVEVGVRARDLEMTPRAIWSRAAIDIVRDPTRATARSQGPRAER